MAKKLGIPIAYAGPSRITGLTRIKLSGSDSLFAKSFLWSLVSKPSNSLAMLNKANVEQTTLIADVIGDYVVELTVANDSANSAPSRITITVSNEVNLHPSTRTRSLH